MRKDVEFETEDGVTLRGWLYLPDEARGRVPTIVMAQGLSAVKENYLDKYGEVYSAASGAARDWLSSISRMPSRQNTVVAQAETKFGEDQA